MALSIEYDPKLTIEGVITAVGVIIGVLGAVLGFLIDLARRRKAQRKDERERADRLTIMEILERDLLHGLSERQIKDIFCSAEMGEFRKRAGTSNPDKLTDNDFSRYLRDLQWNHMIDQIDATTYRLRTRALDQYENKEAWRQELKNKVRNLVQEEKLLKIISDNFDKLQIYQKVQALETLGSMKSPEAIKRVIAELDSPDPQVSLAAARTLLDILV
ncbi:MAG TPA: HEAT repeat domain-containing protein [Blastocatellia bacterium]|nr:HEAT repeat domain-containing protein [Blastocatellia bacterium]